MVAMVVAISALSALPLAAQSPRFTRDTSTSGQPTVIDNRTGLEWQGCSAGQSGADCTTGSAGFYSWQAALDYCEGLSWSGDTDWRLPSVSELQSIVDNRKTTSPFIDEIAFPATPGGIFSSSSSCAYADWSNFAWYVLFGYGHVDGYDKNGDNRVRCVRRGP